MFQISQTIFYDVVMNRHRNNKNNAKIEVRVLLYFVG